MTTTASPALSSQTNLTKMQYEFLEIVNKFNNLQSAKEQAQLAVQIYHKFFSVNTLELPEKEYHYVSSSFEQTHQLVELTDLMVEPTVFQRAQHYVTCRLEHDVLLKVSSLSVNGGASSSTTTSPAPPRVPTLRLPATIADGAFSPVQQVNLDSNTSLVFSPEEHKQQSTKVTLLHNYPNLEEHLQLIIQLICSDARIPVILYDTLPRSQHNNLCKSLLDVTSSISSSTMTVIDQLLDREFAGNSGKPYLILRAHNLVSKLIARYVRAQGTQYIKSLFGQLITTIQTMAGVADPIIESKEISSHSVLQLSTICEAILERFETVGGAQAVPRNIRAVFFLVYKYSDMYKVGQVDRSSMIQSIFLDKFICQSLLSPSLYRLDADNPSGSTYQTLVQVTKILHKCANKELFKEYEALYPMNDFIRAKGKKLRAVMKYLHLDEVDLMVPKAGRRHQQSSVNLNLSSFQDLVNPDNIFDGIDSASFEMTSLSTLHEFLYTNRQSIIAKLYESSISSHDNQVRVTSNAFAAYVLSNLPQAGLAVEQADSQPSSSVKQLTFDDQRLQLLSASLQSLPMKVQASHAYETNVIDGVSLSDVIIVDEKNFKRPVFNVMLQRLTVKHLHRDECDALIMHLIEKFRARAKFSVILDFSFVNCQDNLSFGCHLFRAFAAIAQVLFLKDFLAGCKHIICLHPSLPIKQSVQSLLRSTSFTIPKKKLVKLIYDWKSLESISSFGHVNDSTASNHSTRGGVEASLPFITKRYSPMTFQLQQLVDKKPKKVGFKLTHHSIIISNKHFKKLKQEIYLEQVDEIQANFNSNEIVLKVNQNYQVFEEDEEKKRKEIIHKRKSSFLRKIANISLVSTSAGGSPKQQQQQAPPQPATSAVNHSLVKFICNSQEQQQALLRTLFVFGVHACSLLFAQKFEVEDHTNQKKISTKTLRLTADSILVGKGDSILEEIGYTRIQNIQCDEDSQLVMIDALSPVNGNVVTHKFLVQQTVAFSPRNLNSTNNGATTVGIREFQMSINDAMDRYFFSIQLDKPLTRSQALARHQSINAGSKSPSLQLSHGSVSLSSTSTQPTAVTSTVTAADKFPAVMSKFFEGISDFVYVTNKLSPVQGANGSISGMSLNSKRKSSSFHFDTKSKFDSFLESKSSPHLTARPHHSTISAGSFSALSSGSNNSTSYDICYKLEEARFELKKIFYRLSDSSDRDYQLSTEIVKQMIPIHHYITSESQVDSIIKTLDTDDRGYILLDDIVKRWLQMFNQKIKLEFIEKSLLQKRKEIVSLAPSSSTFASLQLSPLRLK